MQKAKDLNINVDPEVTRELADIQVRAKISDPDKFKAYIQEQTGMSYEDYRDQLKRQFLSQRVIGQEVGYRINIPEADLRKYYEEHKTDFVRKEQVFLSQILISTEGKTPEQVAAAEKKAKDLVARARKGEKFSELVRENSDDRGDRANGGSLPPYRARHAWRRTWKMSFSRRRRASSPIPFKDSPGLRDSARRRALRGRPGQLSKRSGARFRSAGAAPQMEPQIREFLTRLRTEAFLEIKDGYIDSGAAPGKDTRWRDVAQLKPQTTTKEEVAARVKRHKKFLFIPIPGTTRKAAASSGRRPRRQTHPAPARGSPNQQPTVKQ